MESQCKNLEKPLIKELKMEEDHKYRQPEDSLNKQIKSMQEHKDTDKILIIHNKSSQN